MGTKFYETSSYICLVISAMMFACSVILFLKLKIPEVIGELTGKTAKKAIEKLKEKENVYNKSTSPIKMNFSYNEMFSGLKTTKITEKIVQKTEKMQHTQPLDETDKLMDAEIEDDTRLLEEYSIIPIKQINAEFQITKDEMYVHDENATELLKE